MNSTAKIAIIGSGPAGLTAAIYTARAFLDTTIYMGMQPGGQLTTTTEIENFPGFIDGIAGPTLMENMQKQAERFGAVSISKEAKQIIVGDSHQFTISDSYGESTTFDAIIIASGASARYLGLPGEEKYVGRGYHSCATCDGFFYKGKNIFLVGGGDSAMEDAIFLTKFADSVTIINRSQKFRASPIMLKRAQENPKIKWLTDSVITAFYGEDKLNQVDVQNVLTKETTKHTIDGVFVAIGHNPNTEFVKDILDKDDLGYLIPLSKQQALLQTNPDLAAQSKLYTTISSIPGIFIAGDVTDKHYRQAITAAGEGCKASIDLEKWLEAKAG